MLHVVRLRPEWRDMLMDYGHEQRGAHALIRLPVTADLHVRGTGTEKLDSEREVVHGPDGRRLSPTRMQTPWRESNKD